MEFCSALLCCPFILLGWLVWGLYDAWQSWKNNREIKRQEVEYRQSLEQEQAEKERLEQERIAKILSHKDKWPQRFIEMLIDEEIAIGMTEQMVEIAWGKDYSVDQFEFTPRSGKKTRWVYGRKRHNARYVWFTDGRVSKIKDNR